MSEVLLAVLIEALTEGGFLATSDELPGLLAQGRTIAETLEIALDGAQKLIESYNEHGDPLPPALLKSVGKSRRVAVRVPYPDRRLLEWAGWPVITTSRSPASFAAPVLSSIGAPREVTRYGGIPRLGRDS